ncbi:MAG: DUF4433 domain-containing protein, partial [Pseudobdellovibrionaceae bacterium]|nr:DUF4433 domain-containing protein [Pseudobdellovibrionaceae bacterium]
RNVSDRNIQDRRSKVQVCCPPGGILHDYVPFYFNARSPMLYRIKHNPADFGNVMQSELIYLTTTAEAVTARGLPYVFTDGHAAMAFSIFYNDIVNLPKIDWDVIKGRMWIDTDEFPDRRRRRQAEFLIYLNAPWDIFDLIGVYDLQTKNEVEQILASHSHKPHVAVKSGWYY